MPVAPPQDDSTVVNVPPLQDYYTPCPAYEKQEQFREHWRATAITRMLHATHSFTCHKGIAGKKKCRMGYPKIFRNRRSYMLQFALALVAGEAGYGLIYGDYNSSNPAMTCQHDDPLCAVCRPMLLFELYRPDSDQTKTDPIQALDHLASQHYQHVCSDPGSLWRHQ